MIVYDHHKTLPIDIGNEEVLKGMNVKQFLKKLNIGRSSINAVVLFDVNIKRWGCLERNEVATEEFFGWESSKVNSFTVDGDTITLYVEE